MRPSTMPRAASKGARRLCAAEEEMVPRSMLLLLLLLLLLLPLSACARVRVRGMAVVQAGREAAQLPSAQALQEAAAQFVPMGMVAQVGHRAAEARQVRVVGQA